MVDLFYEMIRMMIIVVIIFTICWLPMNTLIVVADQDDSIWRFEHIVYIWFMCHWMAMSHGCYNPIIYCWMNARFREGFHHVLVKLHLRSKSGNISENGSLRRCNTFTTTYTSARNSSARSTYRNGFKTGSRSQRDLSEMQMFKKNSQTQMSLYDDDDTITKKKLNAHYAPSIINTFNKY
uniref:G-protein coupled receptors family 1 profile domain-containing protein n=1 Tax=Strigamia maritima TaxID=126957 RepID=T1J5B0_STRMM